MALPTLPPNISFLPLLILANQPKIQLWAPVSGFFPFCIWLAESSNLTSQKFWHSLIIFPRSSFFSHFSCPHYTGWVFFHLPGDPITSVSPSLVVYQMGNFPARIPLLLMFGSTFQGFLKRSVFFSGESAPHQTIRRHIFFCSCLFMEMQTIYPN